MNNKTENIQIKYREHYLKKINGFEVDYNKILNKYLDKIRKIIFDHSNNSGNLNKSSKNTVVKSIKLLNNWLRIETEDIISNYILQTIKIALLGQIKALKWYAEHIGITNSDINKLKNKYNKEKITNIREEIWNKKWSDGLNIDTRLDKLNKTNVKEINNIINKNLNSNNTIIVLFNNIVYRTSNPEGLSYKNQMLRIARTETNSAYRLTQKLIGEDADNVIGIKWNLSTSHPNYSYYEVCERYAKEDHAGLEPGVYKPKDLPEVPHPECLCYLTFLFKN